MKIKKRSLRVFSVLLMVCVLLNGAVLPVHAKSEVIHIRSLDDWKMLAQNCTLDTWSQGISVVLDCDLVLTDANIIPTFGGTFDGNGHTISELNLIGEGSHLGLFRYLQESGTIRNLTVSGSVSPAGTCSAVGGIVGTNYGVVSHCTFRGTVEASTGVGGIAGVNEATGQMIHCTSYANVTGEHYTGGITGENYGSVVLCINYGQVNTHETQISPELDEVNWKKLNDMENVPACTDSGGIAGYSKGILQNCSNQGTVGYPHTGYNVGGIVGRTAGYVDGCTNSGNVRGRKEVGGIAGQMEPYTMLQFQQDQVSRLLNELENLSTCMDTALRHAQTSGTDISSKLTAISQTGDSVRMDLNDIMQDMEDWSESTIDTVNDLSARIARVLDQSDPMLSQLQASCDSMTEALNQLQNALNTLDTISDPNSTVYQEFYQAFTDLTDASSEIQDGIQDLSDAVDLIRSALGNEYAMENSFRSAADAMTSISYGFQDAQTAVEALAAGFRSLENLTPEERTALQETETAFADLQESLRRMAVASDTISPVIMSLSGSPSDEEWVQAMEKIGDALDDFADAADDFNSGMQHLQSAIPELNRILSIASDQLNSSLRSTTEASVAMSSAISSLRSIIKEQAEQKPLEIPKIDSGFHERQDHLNTGLDTLSQQLETLNQTASASGTELLDDLQSINQQFRVIVNVFRDISNTGSTEVGEQIVDISEEDSNTVTVGKIARCVNRGTVSGDINIGGLTGAMAIEFDYDPEDDLSREGSTSTSFQYLTRAVLRDSVNYGDIDARKNYLGGAVGRMDLGLVIRCENYGNLKSTAGGYVGGIAGQSDAVIEDCWVKCRVDGQRYLGGIAGSGTDISGCRVFASVCETAPYIGSIAGMTEGTLSGNFFVSDSLGGVDGISYSGKAEAIPYQHLMELEAVPEPFKAFTLTFLADDQVVTSRVFHYGDALSPDRLPDVPEKEGFYGAWEVFDMDHLVFDMKVHAEYSPWITTLESETGEILAEGTFMPGTQLLTETSKADPPEMCGDQILLRSIRLTDPSAEFTALRVHMPDDWKHPKVWILRGETWEEAEFTQDGSYLYIPCSANSLQICISDSGTSIPIYLVIGCSVSLLLLGSLLLWRKHH